MQIKRPKQLDISIIMPCLNESASLRKCIKEAEQYLTHRKLNGEIIIVDNGSTDNSADIARKLGTVVETENKRGYGSAIKKGISQSRGAVLIIGDCDTTYDFSHLDGFYDLLSKGCYDVIIGNRFTGGIEKGAMPVSHRFGAEFLSICGRLRYHVKIRDFHCGLRGMTREAAEKMCLRTDSMEFATEMIAEASRLNLKTGQVPAKLRKNHTQRISKLRAIPDGIRHLKFIMLKRNLNA